MSNNATQQIKVSTNAKIGYAAMVLLFAILVVFDFMAFIRPSGYSNHLFVNVVFFALMAWVSYLLYARGYKTLVKQDLEKIRNPTRKDVLKIKMKNAFFLFVWIVSFWFMIGGALFNIAALVAHQSSHDGNISTIEVRISSTRFRKSSIGCLFNRDRVAAVRLSGMGFLADKVCLTREQHNMVVNDDYIAITGTFSPYGMYVHAVEVIKPSPY